FNVPGAGGTIGLARLVSTERGAGDLVMITGLVMVGAIITNQSAVSLAQTTPIARLTAEYEVIAVPANSPFQTLDDLLKAFKENPRAISWAGGPAGGLDHMLVGLLAKEVGVAPSDVNYIPFSGGGEALAAMLGGHVSAGVTGYGEWAAQIEAGNLRALAITSAQRVPGINIPTLIEQGVNIELANWRGELNVDALLDQGRDVDPGDPLGGGDGQGPQVAGFDLCSPLAIPGDAGGHVAAQHGRQSFTAAGEGDVVHVTGSDADFLGQQAHQDAVHAAGGAARPRAGPPG